MDLNLLVSRIQSINTSLQIEAGKSVNKLLTIRNWIIGYYIVEYEQKGEDRARYGENLLSDISASLKIKGLSVTNLKVNRLFYILYPGLNQILSETLKYNTIQITDAFSDYRIPTRELLPLTGITDADTQIGQTASDELQNNDMQIPDTLELQEYRTRIGQTASDELQNNDIQIGQTASDQLQNNDTRIGQTASDESKSITYQLKLLEKIVNQLSFSHITLLLQVENEHKRTFYAIEAIKGTWSVRELRRQITSLLFERMGISQKPEKLLNTMNEQREVTSVTSLVKDIYTFEFLGFTDKDIVEESDLETALLDHFQHFLLEMGHGFCLEGRQKRILIGNEYLFVDLVFYHRILKCHILVELKVDEFNHTNAGQLNTYINYYKKEVQAKDDNPPVGILLVTNKNEALVEYATADMDKALFVRKYMLELPNKSELESFIRAELRKM